MTQKETLHLYHPRGSETVVSTRRLMKLWPTLSDRGGGYNVALILRVQGSKEQQLGYFTRLFQLLLFGIIR